MAKALLILSVILMLVTAGLGFATRNKVNELQGSLTDTKRNLQTANTSLSSAKAAQKTAEENLRTAEESLKTREGELATTKSEMGSLTQKLTEATQAVEARTQELTALQDQLKNMSPGETGTAVDAEGIAQKVNQLNAALAKAETDLAEAQQVQATLTRRTEEAESKLASVQQQVRGYQEKITQTGIQGRVLAYNPGWNFVVLNVGDRQGIRANASMIVVRNGQRVARVRVTSVEPTTAIADVLPGTLGRGETVQPGDTVIVEGSR
jgi:myosin heavy subunit